MTRTAVLGGMVTVLVVPMGGLGNLLFQVAAGRELASRRGSDLRVAPVASRREREQRPALWDALGEEVPEASAALLRRVQRAGRSRVRAMGVARLEQRASQAFDPPAATAPTAPVVVLQGYFQHPGYFGGQPEALAPGIRAWAQATVGGSRSDVVVHLRRGDYLPRGWQLPLAYYERAVSELAEALPGPRTARVVGDDRLAAEGLSARLTAVVPRWAFEVAPERSLAADFGLLATADHLVLSNSTFAWWAAVVGDADPARPADRRVLAPAAWLGTRAHALLRPTWTQLPEGDPGLA